MIANLKIQKAGLKSHAFVDERFLIAESNKALAARGISQRELDQIANLVSVTGLVLDKTDLLTGDYPSVLGLWRTLVPLLEAF